MFSTSTQCYNDRKMNVRNIGTDLKVHFLYNLKVRVPLFTWRGHLLCTHCTIVSAHEELSDQGILYLPMYDPRRNIFLYSSTKHIQFAWLFVCHLANKYSRGIKMFLKYLANNRRVGAFIFVNTILRKDTLMSEAYHSLNVDHPYYNR